MENVKPVGGDLGQILTFVTPRGEKHVLMYFRGKEWLQRLEVMRVGDHVKAQGRIERIEQWGVSLDPCEIVD